MWSGRSGMGKSDTKDYAGSKVGASSDCHCVLGKGSLCAGAEENKFWLYDADEIGFGVDCCCTWTPNVFIVTPHATHTMPFSLFFFLMFQHTSTTTTNTIIHEGNNTLQSPSATFKLGLLSFSLGFYLAIRHASFPTPSTIWVTNRCTPTPSFSSSALHLSGHWLY
ncbi:hypothetical protein Fmac_000525 [Flemingia macrophylla]|uniref:Uncharacterized protein n=1 Tax=Flemingia macrophylla TaxID=520843 RepID=A0ABD1NEH3_9FABA